SSRAALVAALKRRRTRGLALASAVECGRLPTRSELSAWTHGDDAVQLAFPDLVAAHSMEPGDHAATPADLLRVVTEHNDAIERLLAHLRGTPDPDAERAAVLAEIRAAHPGERVIAFCQYAETVHALRARLARVSGVAALTAAGARIASGRVSRDEVLAQFTPTTGRRAAVGRADRVGLLLTTDLLSEGLNLQEASVIVHLDLPWNPARLEQRVGRVRRLGSRFPTVTVYTIAPPASADRLLRLDERLRDKIRMAQRTVGIAGQILPATPLAFSVTGVERGLAESHGVLRQRLSAWRAADDTAGDEGQLLVAGVAAPSAGFLALVQGGDGAQLVASVGSALDRSPETIARAIAIAEGCAAAFDETSVGVALHRLEQWLSTERAVSMIDFSAATASRARRHALSKVAQALARAPRHRRALLAPLASAARAAAVAPLGEGAERILDMLVGAELPDEAWLRSIAAFGEVNARPAAVSRATQPASVVALILFVPR
ncbi:MAG TPA: C-terminal helicase domain-containing protein, partial [Gemmatimonadaceae bacterium]|nr:C-terminal helicase domain-containing protein [Gemmatimonadaceae bacterium]